MSQEAVSPARALAILLACACACAWTAPAKAHPHVWVQVKTAIVFKHCTIAALEHQWAFDEFYAVSALEGLDANNDGIYDRKELAELAQTNMDGLKGFSYFTFAKADAGPLKFGAPANYWLEYKDKILTLHFTLPFEQPVPAKGEGFSFSVYDPSFYVALELAKDDPVHLAGVVPPGCGFSVGLSAQDASDAERLAQAFSKQLGGGNGGGLAKPVSVHCSGQ